MANCVKSRFSLNMQLFSVVLKSALVKYIATYCPWDSHQIHSSCTSMSLWWQNNPSLWLSWTVSIPKWVSILWRATCASSDAKLFEGGVENNNTSYLATIDCCSLAQIWYKKMLWEAIVMAGYWSNARGLWTDSPKPVLNLLSTSGDACQIILYLAVLLFNYIC